MNCEKIPSKIDVTMELETYIESTGVPSLSSSGGSVSVAQERPQVHPTVEGNPAAVKQESQVTDEVTEMSEEFVFENQLERSSAHCHVRCHDG